MQRSDQFLLGNFLLALFLCVGMQGLAHADGAYSVSRGQLLYMKYCHACHTEKVHWREQKLVLDWSGLVRQVERWQRVAGLDWKQDEIDDVAYYLNNTFYKYTTIAGNSQSMQLLKNYK